MNVMRLTLIGAGLLLGWQVVILLADPPYYILPGPWRVFQALITHLPLLAGHALTTVTEIVAGLIIGTMLGALSALSMIACRGLKRWLLPVLVVSQAIPVFALAPLLVLWLGYGLGSKIAMAVLIIFFPVTAAFYDGLRRTQPEWLELARVMGGHPRLIMRHIRIPGALPAFASPWYQMAPLILQFSKGWIIPLKSSVGSLLGCMFVVTVSRYDMFATLSAKPSTLLMAGPLVQLSILVPPQFELTSPIGT